MTISDRIAEAKDAQPQTRTMFKSFYAWYDALSEEDRIALDSAILSQEVSLRKLFYVLKTEEKVTWGDNALYFHANTLRNKEN